MRYTRSVYCLLYTRSVCCILYTRSVYCIPALYYIKFISYRRNLMQLHRSNTTNHLAQFGVDIKTSWVKQVGKDKFTIDLEEMERRAIKLWDPRLSAAGRTGLTADQRALRTQGLAVRRKAARNRVSFEEFWYATLHFSM